MGVAVTLGLSFLLIIPIEPIYWLLSLPAGLLIGYYANTRADRRHGPLARILVNGLFSGLVTGLTLAVFLLAIKAIFFYADTGYPDFNRVDPTTGQLVPPLCDNGRGCVWARYDADRGADLRAAGIADPAAFERYYWQQQGAAAGMLVILATVGGVAGAALYGTSRSKADRAGATAAG
jgi:hypothetical protein